MSCAKLCPSRYLGENHWAFTLLEVMIAMSIIAIALVTLLGSQSRSLSHATEAQFNVMAPMLAALKLAEVERKVVDAENSEGDFDEDFPGYSWKMEIEEAAFEKTKALAGLDPPLQKLELTVSLSGAPYRYSLLYYGRWQE
jgi:general secretion pathway protein I